jgi:hypothetical protein
VGPFKPEDWPRFIRFPAFTRDWERLALSDAALRALDVEILKDPTPAPVIRAYRVELKREFRQGR